MMPQYLQSWVSKLGLVSCLAMGGAIASLGDCALAQITPDRTLPNNSVVTPQDNNWSIISGGTQVGSNLFHSFEEFSVPIGGAVSFNNALDIQNIISRVTGSSISNINGLIRANGTANLFLLNPNGIIFGPNALLNIGGSFVGSTASAVNFADGTQFSGTAHPTTPLLTISVPLGLQFGGTAGGIRIQGATLRAQPGTTLGLVGGYVALESGNLNKAYDLQADEARIELGSVGSPSLVSLTPTEQGLVLGYEGVQNFQDILLQSGYVNGDDIQVRGRQVTLIGTEIDSITNLTVTASDSVEVSGGSSLSTGSNLFTSLDAETLTGAGTLTIEAGQLIVQDEARVETTTTGTLTIETGQLIVQDEAQVKTTTTGYWNAGDLVIRASDSVKVSEGGSIFALTELGSKGAGGNLTIETPRLEGTQVAVGSFGLGPIGKLTLIGPDPIPNVSTQIVPDESLPIRSTVRSNFNNWSIISGGTQVGSNLFHSFAEFSIPTLRTAYFNNAPNIQNIISRVTGNSISNIDGLIQANASANLFLLNPNGIIFGPNARLNIGGSFLGSTASSLKFANDTQFSATAPQTTSLLTMSVPIGLQFGGGVGSILNQSVAVNTVNGSLEAVGLQVQPGKTLALVGGDVTLKGGNLTALAGRIELGSVAGPSVVNLTPTDKGWALGYQGVQNFKDIQLSQAAWVSTDATLSFYLSFYDQVQSGGEVQVQGRRVSVRDGSHITADNNLNDSRGTLVVNASESVELIGSSADGRFSSNLTTTTLGSGAAGNISINTSKLIVRDGAYVLTGTLLEGQAGELEVIASDSVELSGTAPDGNPSRFYTGSAQTISTGDAGDLTISTGRLTVRDGAYVSTSTSGQGQGGDLEVTASDSVELSGTSGTTPDGEFLSGLYTGTTGAGDAGDLTIETEKLTVRDWAVIAVSSLGSGDAGNLEATARSISLENQAELRADTTAGQGNIFLRSGDLVLRGNSNITTDARGTATGGNITIDTDILAALENSDISANASEARGGRVIIDASGIFGTEFREKGNLATSDITATSELGSEFSGIVEINTPDVDPSQGLVALPAVPIETEVVQTCTPGGSGQQSEFFITGRGGLPPNPTDFLNTDAVWIDLDSTTQIAENHPRFEEATQPTNSTAQPRVEATEWLLNDKGEVILIASRRTATYHIPRLTPANCHAPQKSS